MPDRLTAVAGGAVTTAASELCNRKNEHRSHEQPALFLDFGIGSVPTRLMNEVLCWAVPTFRQVRLIHHQIVAFGGNKVEGRHGFLPLKLDLPSQGIVL